jgi:hypothetical protein
MGTSGQKFKFRNNQDVPIKYGRDYSFGISIVTIRYFKLRYPRIPVYDGLFEKAGYFKTAIYY